MEHVAINHIRNLFHETEDGKMSVTLFDFDTCTDYTLTYAVNWTAEDCEALVARFSELTDALSHIAQKGLFEEEAQARARLCAEHFAVWETFLRPFTPFEGDLNEVAALLDPHRCESVGEEDGALLARYDAWQEENALSRLPALCKKPTGFLLRARRFAKLASLCAPKAVLDEEAKALAEEMILYYHFDAKNQPKNELDEILSGNAAL